MQIRFPESLDFFFFFTRQEEEEEEELVDRSTPFAISYYSCYPVYPGGIARPMRSGFSQPRAQTEQRLKNVVCGVRPGPYPCAVRRPVDTYRERKMVDTRIDEFLRLWSARGGGSVQEQVIPNRRIIPSKRKNGWTPSTSSYLLMREKTRICLGKLFDNYSTKGVAGSFQEVRSIVVPVEFIWWGRVFVEVERKTLDPYLAQLENSLLIR